MTSRLLLLAAFVLIVCFVQYACGVRTVEYEVCTADGTQANPQIEVILIVWQDDRNGNWDIYGYDMSRQIEYAICTADGNQTNPTIGVGTVLNDPIIAWQDDRDGNDDIYGFRLLYHQYDLALGEEIVICNDPCDQRNPVSEGGYVYWQDNRGGDWDIYAKIYPYEGEPNQIVVCDDAGDQINPDAFDDIVAWQDDRNGNWDIYAYDLSESNLWTVCTADGNQTNPACTTGPQFVWQDDRNANPDVYSLFCSYAFCDFNEYTEVEVVTDSNSQQYPDITDRDFIVWQDDRHGNWDIYGYEPGPYGTGTEFAISTEAVNQVKPDVSEGIVVWQDARSDSGDIYAARICARGNDQCDGECVIELLDDQPYYGSTEEMAATYWAGHDQPLKSSCGFNDFVDAWHVYRPTIGGPVTITTDESQLDTILSVFNSCHTMDDVYEDPIELACNDDYCLAHAGSKVTLTVVKGKSYYIRVSGFNDQRGDYRILVERGAATDPVLSDLNGDGCVNMLDFAVFSAEWLMTNQPAE